MSGHVGVIEGAAQPQLTLCAEYFSMRLAERCCMPEVAVDWDQHLALTHDAAGLLICWDLQTGQQRYL